MTVSMWLFWCYLIMYVMLLVLFPFFFLSRTVQIVMSFLLVVFFSVARISIASHESVVE